MQAWSVTASSVGNPTKASSFTTITTSGAYSAGVFSEPSFAGSYTVSTTSITINGVPFSTFTGTSAFSLTVIDPCLSAVVIASALTDFSLEAYDALASYATFSDFTYTTTTGFSSCGSFTYTASIAPSNSLSTFVVDSTNKDFSVYSGSLSQVGTYTVTLTGKLTSYTTQLAT